MRKSLPALLALCILALAGTASALQVDTNLVAVSAMPLAVADVIALPDVPSNDVVSVVTTLNRAAVPAPQFVEVVRYVPVALTAQAEPPFTTFVTQEYDRGIVGQPLALAIADRYNSYGIRDVNVVDPPVMTIVEQRQILPSVVVTQYQPVSYDPLALVAMPLAVAAVSNLTNVPASDLMSLVASLNAAAVPAPQFVEVVRYAPVVMVDQTAEPQFIQYVTTQVDRGVRGRPLAYAVAQRIRTYQPVEINVVRPEPRRFVERDEILPPAVVRVASMNPHGGPPGLLKKQLGLQTGAEVVHGAMPGREARLRMVEQSYHRTMPRPGIIEEQRDYQLQPQPATQPTAVQRVKPHAAHAAHARRAEARVRADQRYSPPVVRQQRQPVVRQYRQPVAQQQYRQQPAAHQHQKQVRVMSYGGGAGNGAAPVMRQHGNGGGNGGGRQGGNAAGGKGNGRKKG